MRAKRLVDSRGQALAITAVALLVLLAMAGLAADGGMFLARRRSAQTAADAAAMAGAVSIWKDPTPAPAAAAQNSASVNGFTNGTNGVTVTVNSPPVNGYYAGKAKFVEAIVSQQMSTLFLGAVGYGTMTPRARAVAGPVNAPVCIQTLSQNSTGMDLSGNSSIDLGSCGLVVNSVNASKPINTHPGSVTAGSITVAGPNDGCTCSPTPQYGALPLPDPFAGLSPPTRSVCDFGAIACSNCTLNPGNLPVVKYCGKITIHSTTATFNPGTYIVTGGIDIQGGGTVITGSDVSLYISGGSLVISGGGSVTLSAPTTGPLPGILFFQDSLDTSNVNIQGGSTATLEGVLYFPSALVNFSASTGSGACTEIIADRMKFTGTSSVGGNCAGYPDGTLISSVALAE